MSHSISYPTHSGIVVGKNVGLNSGTSPALWNVPTNKVMLTTIYVLQGTNTVHDLGGQPQLPSGSPVEEKRQGSATFKPINQSLKSDNTYTDPTGFFHPVNGPIVDITSPSYTNWLSAPTGRVPCPFGRSETQNIAIRIGGSNTGGITNRRVTLSNAFCSSTTAPMLRIQ